MKIAKIIYGILTLYDVFFQRTFINAFHENVSINYNSERKSLGFKIWAFPGSFAITEGILVSFFSSAYWYA